VGTYAAHNNVTRSSNGKWEDGIYDMLDTDNANMHPDQYEADGITLQDSENGRYGAGGIYRAETFTETTTGTERSGMGSHAGRENKIFEDRKTLGCIRTTSEAITAIQSSIESNGALHTTVVRNNRSSNNSRSANNYGPGRQLVITPFNVQRDNTRVVALPSLSPSYQR
jgi:hypothetical protein